MEWDVIKLGAGKGGEGREVYEKNEVLERGGRCCGDKVETVCMMVRIFVEIFIR